MKMLSKKFAVVAGIAIASVMTTSSLIVAQAAEFVGPKDNGNVTVSATEQHKNLYVVGGNILVNSDTTGDLYIAGGNVTIEGNVEGDLTLAGGTAYVNGTVGGDIRAAAGNLTINDSVGGDLVIAGGTVIVNEKASVKGDLFAMGGEISLLGSVEGQLRVRGTNITVDNVVKGTTEIHAEDQLSIGSKAVFAGNAKYKSIKEAQIQDGAQLGGLQFEKLSEREVSKNKTGFIAGLLTLGFVIKLLAFILTALIVLKLFGRNSNEVVRHLNNNFLMSLLVGLIAFITTPIVAVILMFTVVGFYIAVILLVLWVLYILLSCLVGAVFVGAWLVKKLGKKPELVVDWQAIVIGVVVVEIVSLIPIVGFMAVAVLFLAGMGALAMRFYQAIKNGQEQVIVEEVK